MLRLLEPVLLAPIDTIPPEVVGRLFAFFGSFALIEASQFTRTHASIFDSIASLRSALQTFMVNLLRTYEQGNPFRWNCRPECMQAAFALVVCSDKSVAALMCRLVKASMGPTAETTADALRQLATDVRIPSRKCSLSFRLCPQQMLTCQHRHIRRCGFSATGSAASAR